MKKILFFFMLGAFSIVLNAQAKTGQEPYQTKSLANETIKNVEVETSGGNIAVSGVNASEARIEVYVNGNGNRSDNNLTKEEIKKRLDADYDLNISVSDGKVTAKARPKGRNMDWKRALSISFKVFVPQAVSTDLTTSGGNIQLSNISGDQRFITSGGNLQVDNVSGKTKGTTSGGNIYVKASKDNINLSTSGGNIEAMDCTGSLALYTSGGNLKLHNLNGVIEATTSGGNVQGEDIEGELNARTSGGNIQLSGLACSLETSTSGGHIDVTIKSLRKSVKISNSGGNISLQLPKGAQADLDLRARKVVSGRLETFNGRAEDDEIRGKLNGGGTSVKVDAGSGKVSLSFQ